MTAQVQQPGDARPAAARAGGSSFYLAMRILGREKREAMFEIYSFCRAVDDIADGDVPGDKLALLAAWRENIDALYAGRVPPGLEGLAKAMLDKNPHPTDAQIRDAMNGTLCRCMSYFRVQSAIKRAAKAIADAAPASGKQVVA